MTVEVLMKCPNIIKNIMTAAAVNLLMQVLNLAVTVDLKEQNRYNLKVTLSYISSGLLF
jgi:hypothetical protein